jgi:predicted enzyme related to lactoylglutathione lyase
MSTIVIPMTVFAAYSLVFVREMERAVAFYRSALGASPRVTTPAWSELEVAGTLIALHSGRSGGPAEIPLGFKVLNIDAVANRIVAAGGFIHAPKSKAPGEPAIIKAGDPDGNIFFLSEGPG